MGDLWQRRAVRQMVLGLIPLLVIGLVMATVLYVRLRSVNESLDAASERTTATVARAGIGESGRQVEFTWTDETGAQRTSVLEFPRLGDVEEGDEAELHYEPGDPGNVWVGFDERTIGRANMANGIFLIGCVLVLAGTVTALRISRRLRAERRRSAKELLSVAHSRWGLITRSWLIIERDKREWWLPVYWDPALETIDPKKHYDVHGAGEHHPLQVAQIGDTRIWPAGRRRLRTPRGVITRIDRPASDTPADISMARHLRGDLSLALAAPFLALLWTYLDGSGPGGFGVSTVVLAGVLLWITSVFGSDPGSPERR